MSKSTKRALDAFFKRKLGTPKKRRRNARPEIDLTEKPCLAWLKSHGFLVFKVEAKAVFSVAAGRYLKGQTDPGMTDAVGCCPDGTAAFIEFKAPGKRSTLKAHQLQFIEQLIERDCFAVCVDSVDCLNEAWLGFESMRLVNKHQDYLLSLLPRPRTQSASFLPS